MKKILFLVLLLSTLTSFASHLNGGEISYECLGTRKWKVTLLLYRDCSGIPLCGGFSCSKGITASINNTLGLNAQGTAPPNKSFIVNLVKVEDAELFRIKACGASGKNACTNLNQVTSGPFTPSVEKYFFEGILDLSDAVYANTNFSYWDIDFTENARNIGIVNISNSYAQDLRIRSTLNIHSGSAQCLNNSPVFTNEALFSIPASRETSFSVAAVDPDGDSLTYEIVKALGTGGIPVSYNAPYSEYVPFQLNFNLPPHNQYPGTSGQRVILDTFTGLVRLNGANNTINTIFGQMTFNVNQWRRNSNGQPVLVGVTSRDIQMHLVNKPSNSQPVITTIPSLQGNAPKFDYTVCAGDSVSFIVTANDSDFYPQIPRIDSAKLSWNIPLSRPGKLYVNRVDSLVLKREDKWKFFWQTEASDVRSIPYQISAIAVDNFCPYIGYTTRNFSITVAPSITTSSFKNKVGCNMYNYQVQRLDTLAAVSDALLRVANRPNDFTFTNGYKTINKTAIGKVNAVFNENLVFTEPGNYLVSYTITINQGCSQTKTDTIFVAPFPSSPIQINDTIICRGDTVKFSLSNDYNYTWKQSGSNTVLSTSNLFWYVPTSTVNIVYVATAKDSIYQGCVMSDTSKVVVKYKATVEAGSDKLICSNESNFSIKAKQGITIGGYVTNSSGVTVSDVFRPAQAPVFPLINKFYFVNDSNGCVSKDSFVYTVKRPAVVDAGTNKIMCSNDAAFSLRVKQGIAVSGYFANSLGVAISDTFEPAQALTHPATNKLYFVNDSTGCVGKDSFNYQVNLAPTANAGTDKSYCETDVVVALQTTQQATPAGGIFSDEQSTVITTFNPATAPKLPTTNAIVYKYGQTTSNFTCYGYDTAIFIVTPVAQLQPFIGDVVVAKNAVKTYSTPSNPYHTLVWNVTGGQLQGNQNNQAEILWTDTGMANIKITAQNAACADVVFNQVVLVQGTSGIKEQGLLSSLKLYPNPANRSVTISLTSSKDTHIEIYSATMQLIKQVTAQSIGGEVYEQLSTQDMANGVYFIKVTTGTQSGLFKLVVMK